MNDSIEQLLKLAQGDPDPVGFILQFAADDDESSESSDTDNDAEDQTEAGSEAAESHDNENMLQSGIGMGSTGIVTYGSVNLGHVAPHRSGKGFVGTHPSGVQTTKHPTRAKAALALRELHHYIPKDKSKAAHHLIAMTAKAVDPVQFLIKLAGDAPGNGNKPYGNVTYADPKNGKYPVDTAEHAKAAWAYINKPKNASVYPLNGVSLGAVKAKIKAACSKFGIDISDNS